MPVNCWCEGRNENCAYCGGSGHRPVRVVSMKTKKRPTRRPPQVADVTPHTAQRPPAGKVIRTILIGPGAGESADGAQRSAPRSTPKKASTGSQRGGAKTSGKQPLSHAATHRPGKPPYRVVSAPPSVPAEPPPRRQPPLVRCPHCNASVREDRLTKHRRLVHDQPPRRERESARERERSNHPPGRSGTTRNTGLVRKNSLIGSVRSSTRGACKDDRGEFAREDAVSRSLDGSRNYWEFRREHGRFGSHASFDDYGEESDV